MFAFNGIYLTSGKSFNVVNAGVSKTRVVKITDSFSLPLSASLITNPDARQIHLVFGISF